MLRVPGGRLLFIMPAANDGLWPALDYVLNKVTSGEARSQISKVSIEHILEALHQNAGSPALNQHVDDLRAKYLP
jgi:hypothetical protein